MFCEFCGTVSKCSVCGRNDHYQPPSTRNARFWVYINGSMVKLTLRQGGTLRHATSARTEEGWQSEWNKWTCEYGIVRWESVNDGRDCDGRYSYGSVVTCPVELLATRKVDGNGYEHWPKLPEWEAEEKYQRDYSAEAAGY